MAYMNLWVVQLKSWSKNQNKDKDDELLTPSTMLFLNYGVRNL